MTMKRSNLWIRTQQGVAAESCRQTAARPPSPSPAAPLHPAPELGHQDSSVSPWQQKRPGRLAITWRARPTCAVGQGHSSNSRA